MENHDEDVILELNIENERLRAIIAKKDSIIDELTSKLYNKEKEVWRNAMEGLKLLKGQIREIDDLKSHLDALHIVLENKDTEIRELRESGRFLSRR